MAIALLLEPARPDDAPLQPGEQDVAAVGEEVALGVAEDFQVGRLGGEVARDPGLVEALEVVAVARGVVEDLDFAGRAFFEAGDDELGEGLAVEGGLHLLDEAHDA
ncbi:hypothetical protein D3C78_1560550 [compost metagenome]